MGLRVLLLMGLFGALTTVLCFTLSSGISIELFSVSLGRGKYLSAPDEKGTWPQVRVMDGFASPDWAMRRGL